MSYCCSVPRENTATRLPSVIASTWSWVTWTVVTPRRWCSRPSSARSCTLQLGVEIGERLVEQEGLGMAHDRPPHGDALALAAGQLARLAVEQLAQVEEARRLVDALVDRALRKFAQLERKRDVLAHRHLRIERVVLEHHRDVAVARRDIVDDLAVDRDRAAADRFQPGDHAQQRRLSAAGRADENHELAVVDLEIDRLDGGDRAAAERLAQLLETDRPHLFRARFPGPRLAQSSANS